jgi:hypothetical protein
MMTILFPGRTLANHDSAVKLVAYSSSMAKYLAIDHDRAVIFPARDDQ